MNIDLVVQVIRQAVKTGEYRLSEHATERMEERLISHSEIESVLVTGEAIEWGEDQGGIEVLILGYVRERIPLYVKCAIMTDAFGRAVLVITAHWQDKGKWFTDRVRRR